MLLAIIVIYILLLALVRNRIKDSISRSIAYIYISYWILSIFVSKINPYDYYVVRDSTYVLLLLHVVAFVIGLIIVRNRKRLFSFALSKGYSVMHLVKNPLFVVFFLICFVFIISLFLKQYAMLAVYSLSDVRGDFMELILEDSGIAYLFYNIICTSMYFFALTVAVYMFFFERKWSIILPLFAYVLLYSFLGGGRNQIMTIGYFVLGVLIMSNYINSAKCGFPFEYKLPRVTKFIILSLGVLMIMVMSMLSAIRSDESGSVSEILATGIKDLGETLIEYSTGPIVAFDLATNKAYNMNLVNGYHYGTATFCGFDYFMYMFLHKFGLRKQSSYHTTTTVLQNEYITISSDRGWNYAYTSCMYYYYDFGPIGVILIPFFLGIIARRLIIRIYDGLNIYDIAIVLFVCFCLFMSVFSGYLHKMMTIMYFLVLLFLSRSYKKCLLHKTR